MVNPITPEQVIEVKQTIIPDEVIEIFNYWIARNWNGSQATIRQVDVVAGITERMRVTNDVVYGNHWLDVDDIYREVGWEVVYDKPAYNETYEAAFTFRKRS